MSVTVTQEILDILSHLSDEDILSCTIENASRTALIGAWYPTVVVAKNNININTKLGQKMIEKLPVLHKYIPEGHLKRRILQMSD